MTHDGGMRSLLMLGALLCAPLSLFVLWRGLYAMYQDGGLLWLWVGAVAVMVICLGVASLIDSRQPPP